MEDRLTRVEEKIAYLEQFVGELDGVVRELHDGLAAVKRETGGWRVPTLMAGYLFGLAYVAAFLTYRVAVALGAG